MMSTSTLVRPEQDVRGRVSKDEARRIAEDLMAQHGLEGVAFEFSRGRTTLGTAHFVRGTKKPTRITLSGALLPYLTRAEVVETILHEIAHALVGPKAGHGPAWRAAARRVGADPSRTAHLPEHVVALTSKYEMSCQRCGKKAYYNRRPKYAPDQYGHRGCGGRFGNLVKLR